MPQQQTVTNSVPPRKRGNGNPKHTPQPKKHFNDKVMELEAQGGLGISVSNLDKSRAYADSVTSRLVFEGVMHLDIKHLAKLLENSPRGSISLVGADAMEAFQALADLSLSITTPRYHEEVPHWHSAQTESYLVIEGTIEMTRRHRRERTWGVEVAGPGQLLCVRREICHWIKWQTEDGIAIVHKAPPMTGRGAPPAGRTSCLEGCCHYKNGCILPSGWNPERLVTIDVKQ